MAKTNPRLGTLEILLASSKNTQTNKESFPVAFSTQKLVLQIKNLRVLLFTLVLTCNIIFPVSYIAVLYWLKQKKCVIHDGCLCSRFGQKFRPFKVND